MRFFVVICFVLTAVGAMAQSEPPTGKARIVIYGDFTAMDLNMTEVELDKYPPFQYKSSQKNLVFDLDPGRHTLDFTYHTIVGDRVAFAGLYLLEGQTAYLAYTVSGSSFVLSLVKPEKFKGAANRPTITNHFTGGDL